MEQSLLVQMGRVSGDQPLALIFHEFKVKCRHHPCCGSADGALRCRHLLCCIAASAEPDQRVQKIQIPNLNDQETPVPIQFDSTLS